MKVQERRLAVVAFSALAGILSLASVAWACTYAPRIMNMGAQEGTSGSRVTVAGQGVAPEGVVEIRWNGVNGAKLAQTTANANGDFSAVATVPDVAADVYSLFVVAGDAGVARTAFEVVGSPSAPTEAALATAGSDSSAPRTAWATVKPLAAEKSSPALAIGAGLLAVGLVILFAAFTVASVRGRRSIAR
jgi:hypothetical protein